MEEIRGSMKEMQNSIKKEFRKSRVKNQRNIETQEKNMSLEERRKDKLKSGRTT